MTVFGCVVSRHHITRRIVSGHGFLVVACFIAEGCVSPVTVGRFVVPMNLVGVDTVLHRILDGVGPTAGQNEPDDQSKNNQNDKATKGKFGLFLCRDSPIPGTLYYQP
jgi:hypothetical protein